ncbi:MAG: aminomethyl-transferring glycine dehydrogenase [Bacteroidales bacterium]|nr:aminomethyl-transferring glycine dehydrogenase [Bacteroidales bacterium]
MSAEKFLTRHIGPRSEDVTQMLTAIGVSSLDELISRTVPADIALEEPLNLPDGMSEYQYFKKIKVIASKNKVYKSYIGVGYYNTIFPAVIQRNILENPSWYTSYTPYQAEISQGRLEALLNYQTMISELTGMELANASLLDESTAAAEAMTMFFNARSREQVKNNACKFFVDRNIFPQTLSLLNVRSKPFGIELVVGDYEKLSSDASFFGAILQFPDANGSVRDYSAFIEKMHQQEVAVVVAADLLSLCLLTPPGEWGADAVVGSAQRFGLPMGFGGPHAGYFATRENYKRFLPGRIIGVSKDRDDRPALRMALQTREQHIKRERATSNICTAQALLATMAGMYGVYHGKEGLMRIALHCHQTAGAVSEALENLGFINLNKEFFDTLKIKLPDTLSQKDIQIQALEREINLNYFKDGTIGISLDETTDLPDVNLLIELFAASVGKSFSRVLQLPDKRFVNPGILRRSDFLTSSVFSKYRSETEMMRYIKKLEKKDISLTDSMISLGSCTMKLNAAIELLPLSWPEFGEIHPFVPVDQAEGYHQLFHELSKMLREITGFAAVSFQPNSGAAGEYAGLMVIREFHARNNQSHRTLVLIPSSAHGTNPASAAMAGLEVCIVACDDKGNIDVQDLKAKAEQHKEKLAALMVTYPSTHGVFEQNIREITRIIHEAGGQVYMDGANMNAQVGLTNPAKIGADVCHLNLHKTFAIPHGGGGPGVGPICVAEHLVQYLPTHPMAETGGSEGIGAIAAAPWGSASILTISHAYCNLLGGEGLAYSSKIAILNANYVASQLRDQYGVLYSGDTGYVAHELILECRHFKKSANVTEGDIAKRLMDFGFHAPTLSFPVHGTLMVEPTESESKEELDRFIEVMQTIYREIEEIAGVPENSDNVLKNAPHCLEEVTADEWTHPYSRQKAAFPLPWLKEKKYWVSVARIDDAWGDRNLVCSCAPIHDYQ